MPPRPATAPPSDDETLTEAVLLARQHDEAAFRAVYRAVQPGLLRYVRSLVGDDGEDVASEAWGQIARDIDKFDGDADAFRGWAATIARNRALDHLRRLRRRPTAAMHVDDLVDWASPDDTSAAADDSIRTRAALELIGSLPPDQAEAVLLRVVMGLTAETAAHVLGKRPGAVRTAAHRGLRRLADQIGQPHAAARQRRPREVADE